MDNNSLFSKYFKSSEEVISMMLGLLIVIVAASLVVNYFQKRRGSVNLAGLSKTNIAVTPTVATKEKNEYVVKKGDNLWKIAERETGSGYNWVAIAKDNKLKNPGVLTTNQKLIISRIEIPKETVTIKEAPVTIKQGSTYMVVRGDSLWKIAVKNYGDGFKWTKIWNSNKKTIKNPNKLEIGMKILVE